MTIRIVHVNGVGDWPFGAVVDVSPEQEGRVRRSLLQTGYAVEVRDDSRVKVKKGKD